MTNTLISHILFLFCVFCSFTCKKDIDEECATCPPPPPHVPKIALSIDHFEASEAWVRLRTTDSSALGPVMLAIDKDTMFRFQSDASDTVCVFWSLSPKRSYNFQAYRMLSLLGGRIDSTPPVTITTPDTTSSNFTWQKFKFGERINGYLNDVAIINDTCIYAVGFIPVKDSTGNINELQTPNAVKWDGKEWNLVKVYLADCDTQNPPHYTTGEITTVYGFSENDVWFADGRILIHWNGSIYQQQCLSGDIIRGGVTRLWGTSSNDLYAVGGGGTIAHYNGQSWVRIETGTTLSITDIWGDHNAETGTMEILAVAKPKDSRTESELFRINGNTAERLSTGYLGPVMSHVWFIPGKMYFLAGGEIRRKQFLGTDTTAWNLDPRAMNAQYIYGMRGNAPNDVVTAGVHGEVLHYNGYGWRRHITATVLNYGDYNSVAMKGDLIVAVGDLNWQALVLVGRR